MTPEERQVKDGFPDAKIHCDRILKYCMDENLSTWQTVNILNSCILTVFNYNNMNTAEVKVVLESLLKDYSFARQQYGKE